MSIETALPCDDPKGSNVLFHVYIFKSLIAPTVYIKCRLTAPGFSRKNFSEKFKTADTEENPVSLCFKIHCMNSNDILGLIAGGLTTISFLPQVIKTWKSRSAKDLSLGMFAIFSVGVLLWFIYGIYTNNIPVIAANALTLVLCSTILYFKLRFKE
jgi:MtN3 and saliva related transmembrane protein